MEQKTMKQNIMEQNSVEQNTPEEKIGDKSQAASLFTEEQIAGFREAFDLMDKDRSGKISTAEIGQMLRLSNLNPTDTKVKEIIAKADVNGDEELDFDEYLQLMADNFQDVDEEKELRDAFKAFDREGTGKISKATLKFILASAGEFYSMEEIDMLFEIYDVNKDGWLDIEEFVKLMTGQV